MKVFPAIDLLEGRAVRLRKGLRDEVTVYTSSRRHVYTIQSRRIVEPTEAEVMAPTRGPTITLISCYPYLIDTHRIVVTGTLKEEL